MSAPLLSPTTGRPLAPDTPHSLRSGDGRWPVIDAIPYLRTGRADLVRETLARLDRGEPEAALALLLADQDDWWDGPRPDESALGDLIARRGQLTLRDAMARLAYGRVGDYFAHRWSDPTFLAGLALVDAHWSAPSSAFELACGIGHHLRELALRGVRVLGGDVVFSKLWLARHWVAGSAELVCFDAASLWPVADRRFDLVLCQDAFYFLEPKRAVLAHMRDLAPAGVLAVGHVHNREADTWSAGAAVTADDIAALFPDAIVYDDHELTTALVEARAPRPRRPQDLRHVEAFSLAAGPALDRAPRLLEGRLAIPPADAALRRNPLYVGAASGPAAIRWPSERYRLEYAARATFPLVTELPETVDRTATPAAAIRRREVVSLPERW